MLENQLDEGNREVYIEGKTGSMQGKRVYAGFDREKHIDRELSYRDDLPLHLSFDFNVISCSVCCSAMAARRYGSDR